MASDNPPFLPVGTAVSAKYRGAFCEAKVKVVKKLVKCKIKFRSGPSAVVNDEHVRGPLKIGAVVEAKQSESGGYEEGTILKLNDASTYTVVFDDGDERTLRRTLLCLQGEKHFHESETLDHLPLTDPENFGTPVMKQNKKRNRRSSNRSQSDDDEDDEDEDEDEESEDEVSPKKQRREEPDDAVGKVVIVEFNEKRKNSLFPALVVDPSCTKDVVMRSKDQIIVRSFKDNKFYTVAKSSRKPFLSKDHTYKGDVASLKAANEKAVTFIDTGQLPSNWDMDMLRKKTKQGHDPMDDTSEDSSDDEYDMEKDAWLASLHKFMEERGTPINKPPVLGFRDLNLYKLFKLVQEHGGCRKVTDKQLWRHIMTKMGIPISSSPNPYNIHTAYNKYLFAFEEFNKKMGFNPRVFTRTRRRSFDRGWITPQLIQHKRSSVKQEKDEASDKEEEETPKKRVSRKKEPEEKSQTPDREEGKDVKRETRDVKTKIKDEEEEKEERPSREDKKASRKSNKDEKQRDKASRDEKLKEKKDDEKEKTVKEDKSKERLKEEKTKDKGADEKNKDKPADDKGKEKGGKGKEGEEEKRSEKTPAKGKAKDKKSKGKESASPSPEIKAEFDVGEKILVHYGRGKTEKIYEAKVVDIEMRGKEPIFTVHYSGWNTRYDEAIKRNRIVGSAEKKKKKLTPKSKTEKEKSKKEEQEREDEQRRDHEEMERQAKEIEQRQKKQKLEKEKAEKEQQEKERKEKERKEKERKEKERKEKERKERLEKERIEKERKERLEREKKEQQEKEAREKIEKERKERQEKEREKQEREKKERLERERREKQEKEKKEKEEQERKEKEKAEQEKRDKEAAEKAKEVEKEKDKSSKEGKKTSGKRGRPSLNKSSPAAPSSPRVTSTSSPRVTSTSSPRVTSTSSPRVTSTSSSKGSKSSSPASVFSQRSMRSDRKSLDESPFASGLYVRSKSQRSSVGDRRSQDSDSEDDHDDHSESHQSTQESEDSIQTRDKRSQEEMVKGAGSSKVQNGADTLVKVTEQKPTFEDDSDDGPPTLTAQVGFGAPDDSFLNATAPHVEAEKVCETPDAGKSRSKKESKGRGRKSLDSKDRDSIKELAAEVASEEKQFKGGVGEGSLKMDVKVKLEATPVLERQVPIETQPKEKLKEELKEEEKDSTSDADKMPEKRRGRKKGRKSSIEGKKRVKTESDADTPSKVDKAPSHEPKRKQAKLDRRKSDKGRKKQNDKEPKINVDNFDSDLVSSSLEDKSMAGTSKSFMSTPPTTPEGSPKMPSSPSQEEDITIKAEEQSSNKSDSDALIEVANVDEKDIAMVTASVANSSSGAAQLKSTPIPASQDHSPKKRRRGASESEPGKKRRKRSRRRKSSISEQRQSSHHDRGNSSDTDESRSESRLMSSAGKHKYSLKRFSGSLDSSRISDRDGQKQRRWNFLVDLSTVKEPDERISIIQRQLKDLRSVYMRLKQEVATIDRRRKKFRKKEREAAQVMADVAMSFSQGQNKQDQSAS